MSSIVDFERSGSGLGEGGVGVDVDDDDDDVEWLQDMSTSACSRGSQSLKRERSSSGSAGAMSTSGGRLSGTRRTML